MTNIEKIFPGCLPTCPAQQDCNPGLSFAQQGLIRCEGVFGFLQHIGSAAKKCQFLAPRSLFDEATVAFTTSNALAGGAQAHGFPPARDLAADGRTQTSV